MVLTVRQAPPVFLRSRNGLVEALIVARMVGQSGLPVIGSTPSSYVRSRRFEAVRTCQARASSWSLNPDALDRGRSAVT